MSSTLRNPTFNIETTAAHFAQAKAAQAGSSGCMNFPVVTCLGEAAQAVRRDRGAAVRLLALSVEENVTGVLLLCCDSELVALLVDVSEPAVRGWLKDSLERGLLRVGLQDRRGVAVVDVACEGAVRDLLNLSRHAKACGAAALAELAGEVADSLRNVDGPLKLIDDVAPSRISLAVLDTSTSLVMATVGKH